MLMTYKNYTSTSIGKRAEEWTRTLLDRLSADRTPSGKQRRLTGHFSFDFILSTKDGEMYPLECNARVHTAVILLPVEQIAECYDPNPINPDFILRPKTGSYPRSWIYNDLIMRYLPAIPFLSTSNANWNSGAGSGSGANILSALHPCLPACAIPPPSPSGTGTGTGKSRADYKPSEELWKVRVDPTLVADDWMPFLVLWHVFWPELLMRGWWQGKKWTRVSADLTGELYLLWHILRVVGAIGVGAGVQRVVFNCSGISSSGVASSLAIGG